MIEVVYKYDENEKQNREKTDLGFKLPKNIKQIGGGDSSVQVYMEDNVALYLNKIPDNEESIRYGVLVGNVKQSCGYTYIFVKGALDVKEIFDNTVLFSDDIWISINDDIHRYFQGEKVVGWFLSQSYASQNQLSSVKRVHMDNFAGMDKVFFRIDRDEEEESFFVYDNDALRKLSCYHIYYEKNLNMEDYLLGTNADINFKKSLYTKEKGGVIENQISKIKENIIMKRDKEIKENEVKNIEENDEELNEELSSDKSRPKYGKLLSKASSFLIIGALAATLAVMGKQGKLDNLTNEVKSMVNGIMNKGESSSDPGDLLSVNGVPKESEKNGESTTGNEDDTSASEDESTTPDETTPVSQEPTQQETTQQETTLPQETESETVSVTPAQTKYYTVTKGETLYSICMKLYGNTSNMNTIIELNHLESADSICYDQDLIVP